MPRLTQMRPGCPAYIMRRWGRKERFHDAPPLPTSERLTLRACKPFPPHTAIAFENDTILILF